MFDERLGQTRPGAVAGGGETSLFSLPEGKPARSYKVVKSLFFSLLI